MNNLADNGSLNTAFGTAVATAAKAHSGTANDLDVTMKVVQLQLWFTKHRRICIF